eukprot:s2461_g23.t1
MRRSTEALDGPCAHVRYDWETAGVRKGIEGARAKEWGNWQGFDAVDVISRPMRVDGNKAQPWEPPRFKSRIVVRGDLESGADDARTDSPTASSVMLNLLLSVIDNMEWKLRGGDITASFLQGDVIERVLLLRPPPGGLPNVPEGSLLRARKPVYGTKDAPRGFWKRLHKVATSKGLKAVPHEHAAYVLQGEGGRIDGMVIAHVDDLLWGGTPAMDKVMNEITQEFKFGSLEFGDKFDYCGRTIEQGTTGIKVTCPNNAAKVRPIHLDASRRSQRECPVTEQERNQLRSVVGSLNWLVRVCPVDIAYEVHRLQAVMSKALVEDLIMCNQILNYVKKTPDKGLYYKYKAFSLEDMTIYSITDASHAADYDVSKTGEPLGHRSQSGRVLTPKTLSMVIGYESAEHLRMVLYGLRNPETKKENIVQAMDAYKIVMMTDCKSLEQHLKQPGLHCYGQKIGHRPQLRQLVWRLPGEDMGDPMVSERPPEQATTTVTWIDTGTMLADGLTKRMRSPQLDEMMQRGVVTVSFEKADNGSRPKKILGV